MKLTSATSWIDDMKQWPAVTYIDIINYLVLSEGVDGEELRNYNIIDSAVNSTTFFTVSPSAVYNDVVWWRAARGSGPSR